MEEEIEISADEVALLLLARERPISAAEPALKQACLNLEGRALLQRARLLSTTPGKLPRAGSAFVLSREGWRRLKTLNSRTRTPLPPRP